MDATAATLDYETASDMSEMAKAGGKALIGTDESTIDDKGRILVPKKKRDRLGPDFALTLSEFGCLVAYPQSVWERKVGELLEGDSLDPGLQQYTRLVVGDADDELNFDQQGRVVIPLRLREAARLTDRVSLVGCVNRVEIWAKDEYERYKDDMRHYGGRRRQAFDEARAQMKEQT